MKKIYFVAISILALFLSVTLISRCKVETNKNDYLKKVLANLEKIKSATYSSTLISSAPGDTLEFKTFKRHYKEYINPSDTSIGSSFEWTQHDNNFKIDCLYDGKANVYLDWNEKNVEIDSFKTSTLPFRPITPPFFNFTKSIIKYALETKDSISTELKDFGDSIKFSLFVPNKIILFYGKPFVYDDPYFSSKEKFSRYDIWINKSNDLPFKFKSKMSFSTYWQICDNVKFNKDNLGEIVVSKYFQKDFPIIVRGKQKTKKIDLTGKVATGWSLQNINNETISLKDLKSKVLMIQFTGIGCGPCHASIPFLKQLVTDYKDKSFELVSIETWSDNITGIKRYCNNNGLNYMFLMSTKDVTKSYQIQSVPSFYILDKNRVIRKIINGYSEKTTDKEIKDAINKLI